MDREDYRLDLNSAITYKLDNLVKELHINYKKQDGIIKLLIKHKDYYTESNIDISKIYSIHNRDAIDLTKEEKKRLDKLRYSLIQKYNYITCKRPYHLLKQIRILNTFRNIPFSIFKTVQDELNIEIINSLLKGNVYSFGNYLGSFRVKFVKRNFKTAVAPDWGASNKLKKQLLADGETLYSEDNPNGKKWIIYRTDNDYCFFAWRKTICRIVNKEYYRFTSISNYNVTFDDLKEKTEEAIYRERGMGGHDKLIALLKLNPQIKERYK